jgi:protein gp37
MGCDMVAPECAHCYIGRIIRKFKDRDTGEFRKPWGEVFRAKTTWDSPRKWQRAAEKDGKAVRVFTCSLSDFFHVKADPWRDEAWQVIKDTPNLVWLVLTKRPELVERRLPADWPYANVWLGVSTGCRATLNKMDTLRRIPVHPEAVRWISSEPLLEDISQDINLDGFGWVVAGGESGGGGEYRWDPQADWREEFNTPGRRTMLTRWAWRLQYKTKAAGLPFMFKQITSANSGVGVDALGKVWHEFPPAPHGLEWAPRKEVAAKHLIQITAGTRD